MVQQMEIDDSTKVSRVLFFLGTKEYMEVEAQGVWAVCLFDCMLRQKGINLQLKCHLH